MTSRSNSWSVMLSPARESPLRSTISRRKRSISSAAILLKLSSSASPASKLLAVNEKRVRPWERVAGSVVEVAEQCEASVLQRGGVVCVFAVETSDEVVNELRDGGVLADDD